MTAGIHEEASKGSEQNQDMQISDRRLWTAVLLQALEDWTSGNMRRRAEAEKFLFNSGKDFATVCQRAGRDPGTVLNKLEGMKKTLRQPQSWLMLTQQAA